MTLPNGHGVLICPFGKDYSMISDADFDLLSSSDDDYTRHLEEINPHVWAEWFCNVKLLELKSKQEIDDAGVVTVIFDYTQNLTQWLFEDNVPVEENLGNYQLPRNYRNTEDSFAINPTRYPAFKPYANEGTGGLPFPNVFFQCEFFIHRNKFYIAYFHTNYTGVDVTMTFTDKKLKMEYVQTTGSITETRTQSIEIIDTFPNK